MKIMGISGMPGSGKALVSEMASKRGALIVSMGDIVREEAKKRGEGSKETAKNLRKEHGEYIISELTIEKIKKINEEGNDKPIVVEGIRSHREVEMFKDNFDEFFILSIFANPQIRYERLLERKREDDPSNYNEFQQRDENELGFGIGNVISLSDRLIINESDMKSYEEKIGEFLEEIGM